VRGKSKLCVALIAVLIAGAFVGLRGVSAVDTVVYIDPGTIHNEDLGLSTFTVTIEVMDVVDLWGFGFTLQFEPLMRVIHPVAGGVNEGTFLDAFATRPVEADRITYFTYSDDVTTGSLHVGCTLLSKIDPYTGDPVTSASGSGTLASVTFLVQEAGSSDIKLVDTKLIDSDTNLIPHETHNGHYFGPYSDLMMAKVSDPKVNVGETVSFTGDAKNFGEVPLYTRIRYDLMREDTLTTFYSGRQYLKATADPLYSDWTPVGTAPYITEVDGSYLEAYWYCQMFGYPTYDLGVEFEDMAPLEPGQEALLATLDVYCITDEPDTNIDIDVYVWLPNYGISWLYLGAAEPFTGWSWISLDLVGPCTDPVTDKLSVDRINDVEVLVHYYYYPGDPGVWCAVDALRISVDVVPKVQPKEKYSFDPFVMGPFDTADVGVYYGTATCWFSYGGTWWNPAYPQRTFKFEVQD
jgi:hypothetical protein